MSLRTRRLPGRLGARPREAGRAAPRATRGSSPGRWSRLPAQTPAAARGRAGSRPPRRESPHGCRRRALCRCRGGRATRGLDPMGARRGGSTRRSAGPRPIAAGCRGARVARGRAAGSAPGRARPHARRGRGRPVPPSAGPRARGRPAAFARVSRAACERPRLSPRRGLSTALRPPPQRSSPRRRRRPARPRGWRRPTIRRSRPQARRRHREGARTWRLGRRRVCGRSCRSQLVKAGRPPRARDASSPRRGSRTP